MILIYLHLTVLDSLLLSLIQTYEGPHPNLLEFGERILQQGSKDEAKEALEAILTYTPITQSKYYLAYIFEGMVKQGMMEEYFPALAEIKNPIWSILLLEFLSNSNEPGRYALAEYPCLQRQIDSLAKKAYDLSVENRNGKITHLDEHQMSEVWEYLMAVELLPFLQPTKPRQEIVTHFLETPKYSDSRAALIKNCIRSDWKMSKPLLKQLAANERVRWTLYAALEEQGKVGRFPRKYAHPDSLAIGICMSYEYKTLPSKVRLIQRFTHTVEGQSVQGYLFLFGEESYGSAGMVGFFDRKGRPITPVKRLEPYQPWEKHTPKEHIERLLEKISEESEE